MRPQILVIFSLCTLLFSSCVSAQFAASCGTVDTDEAYSRMSQTIGEHLGAESVLDGAATMATMTADATEMTFPLLLGGYANTSNTDDQGIYYQYANIQWAPGQPVLVPTLIRSSMDPCALTATFEFYYTFTFNASTFILPGVRPDGRTYQVWAVLTIGFEPVTYKMSYERLLFDTAGLLKAYGRQYSHLPVASSIDSVAKVLGSTSILYNQLYQSNH